MSNIDLEQEGDRLVPLVVDGETKLVPLREVAEAGMRNEDYTRKTQALADDRAALDAAKKENQQASNLLRQLRDNPQGTLQRLADAFNVQIGTKNDDDPPTEDDEDVDPQIRELNEKIARLERAQADTNLKTTVDREQAELRRIHPDIDVDEVMRYAAQNSYGAGMLQQAAKAYLFEQGPTSFGVPEGETIEGLLEAKQQLAGMAGSGRAAPNEYAAALPEKPTDPFDAAFAAAVEEHS